MSLREEVQKFLDEFKEKEKSLRDIYFHDRRKNLDALLKMGITARQREEYILALTVDDYYRGPTADVDPSSPPYFEFGIDINGAEIYIKLSLGKFNKPPQCMSFHFAEHSMSHPLAENSHENS